MVQVLYRVLSYIPKLEVFIRRIYYRNTLIRKTLKGLYSNKKKSIVEDPELFDTLIDSVRKLGIEKGDILIVHSSMDGLERTGSTPEMFIDALLNIVGEEGTLVFPAFPFERKMKKRVMDDKSEEVLVYEPYKTISWTGLMPNIFCRYPGVIRSLFPNNSLAAKGKHAEKMMAANLMGDLPHGKHSAWAYCVERHAKILFLGLSAFHSNTVIHVAEDLMENDWPIKDWYEKRKYIIKSGDEERKVTIRCRKMYWAQFIADHYCVHLLKSNGLIAEKKVEGVIIGYIQNSKQVVDFFMRQAKMGRIVYRIPRRYWKHKS